MADYVTGFQTASGIKKYDYHSLANLPESGADITNTVISPNADYAEVGEWADGNPDRENRLGYFIAIAEVGDNTIKIRKATSTDDIRGVSVYNPAFSGNAARDKYGEDGELLPQYNYIGLMGIVKIIDEGRCSVGGRCISNDDGIAIPSTNNMGYAVLERVDSRHVLIAVEPGADMIQRVKTDIVAMGEEIESKPYYYSIGLAYTLSGDGTYYIVSGIGTCTDTDIKIPPKYEGLPVKEIGESAFAGAILAQNFSITSVVFPHTITKIGNNAFQYCRLNKAILNEGLLEIADYAFHYTSLKKVALPNTIVSIGTAAFNSTNIESIIIPKSVTTLGANIVGSFDTNPTIYCEIAESEKPEGWDNSFDEFTLTKLKVVWNFANDFIAVNEKLENLPAGGAENAVLIFNVSTYPNIPMSAIITAIENAGGDISKVNYVQLNGWLTNLLLMQFRSYGGNTYKVICSDVTNGYKIYNGTTDNVIDISTKTLNAFIAEGTPVTMPQIRFANQIGGYSTISEESPLMLTVEIAGGGKLQEGDTLQLCRRKNYNYNIRDDLGYVVKRIKKKKLYCFAEYTITPEDVNKRFLTVTLTNTNLKENFALNHSGNCLTNRVTQRFLRIRRPKGELQDNDSGRTVDANFSNVVPIQWTYTYESIRIH